MPKVVLIVDDDRTLVHAIRKFLEDAGYQVVTAYDGGEAIEKVKASQPDLILLDIQMPGVHGYSFLFEVRKIEGGAAIPVIILTSSESMVDMFMAEGVREYLIKPCSAREVLEKINKYI
ncbi:MAG: response regulator [Candidatus Omnitrophota bacterium]